MDLAQVIVAVPRAIAEEVVQHLLEAGVPSVEVRDSTTVLPTPEGRAELVTCLPGGDVETCVDALRRYLDALRADGVVVDPWSWRKEPVAADGWEERYQRFFTTTRVGRRFVVRPSWEECDARAEDIVLSIDPGQAFGTGTHPSTRLCLRALERIARLAQRAPDAVLDLGCGSGVLAVAAALLWPEARVQGVDMDPVAVERTCETAARNGVAERVRCVEGSVDAAQGRFDLVLANLQADLLASLRPAIAERLTPRGRIVLSGLLCEQAAGVVEAFVEDLRMEPEYSEDEDGWCMVVVRRRPWAG